MTFWRRKKLARGGGFLSRLARDVRANTMAIMTIALIPLAGMIGGGLDISRMYIVKTRLQHACDAGALAGRKAMGGGTWSQTVNGVANYPNVSAQQFFDANIVASPYGATSLTRSYSESAGKVTGAASAVLPMTLMRIFGQKAQTLSVTCDAEMRLPNTDVMFVLDTTGSMAETPSGDSQTKLASLKISVKCFYEIVARLDTDADCTTGTPSGGTGTQVQIRFGFVPYATNVNVGYLLPTTYFANSWPYQSREAQWTTSTTNGTWTQTGQTSKTESASYSNVSQNYCNDTYAKQLNTSDESTSGTTKTVTTVTYDASSYKNGTCYGTKTTTVTTYTYSGGTTTKTFSQWHYGQITQDISGLKKSDGTWNIASGATKATFTLPIGSKGVSKTITWDGCIEERQTKYVYADKNNTQTAYWPIPSTAYDLNIDLVPDQNVSTSLWAPALNGVIYTRKGSTSNWTTSDVYTTDDYSNSSSYACPTAAKKLQTWSDASTFDTYVDSLAASGNTYHDIGLLWGARLMSATGIFASENAYTPQGGEIERHMIFMTDGDPCTSSTNYQAYGLAWFDKRTTDPSTTLSTSQNCTEGAALTDQVNARTYAICSAIKNMNITLWVITFGSLDSKTLARMKACASDGKYFSATNAATLQSSFASIADQISQLRLTK